MFLPQFQSKSLFSAKPGFTLTELIIVITILSILSVVGFVVMSHQASVARDGKRISDIQTLSQSAKITSAQLRKLPLPVSDALSLSVSGTFIGYQGFMSESLVNPIGYGSDKIYDPKDRIPYTYRVSQTYDQAQFMAYLENPRFERSIALAMIHHSREFLPVSYALDISSIDFSQRYPYSAGDKLGIFLNTIDNTPLQSGISGITNRDLSLSDSDTLKIVVGVSGEDIYLSSLSNSSLTSLRNGTFDEDILLAMNSGGGTGSGGNGGESGGSLSGYVLTMGEYVFLGQQVYGYIGPLFSSGPYASYITTVTAGDLTPKTIDEKIIDSIFFFQGQQILLVENGSGIPNVVISEGNQGSNCEASSVLGSVQAFECDSVSIVGPYTVGEMRSLGMEAGGVVPPPPPPIPETPSLYGYPHSYSENYIYWDSVSYTTSYTLAWSNEENGVYTEIPGITVTNYSHTGLTGNTSYFYKIKAINSTGESNYSNPINIATPSEPPPPAPYIVSITPSNAALTIEWSEIINISDYTLAWSNEENGVYTEIPSIVGTGYTHTGLINNNLYYYKVRSHNHVGPSEWSSSSSGTPQDTPDIPTGLAGDVGNNMVALSWNPVVGASHYILGSSDIEDGLYYEANVFGTGYNVWGLENETPYYFKLKAVNTVGQSDWSSTISITPKLPPSLSINSGENQVDTTWSSVPDSSSYILAWSTSINGTYSEITGITNTGYLHTGLTNGVAYYYRVRGVGSYGMTDWSAITSTTPIFVSYGTRANTISAGMSGACVVQPDTTVRCWGGRMHPPEWLSNVIQVATGLDAACALKSDGTVACWGDYGTMQPPVGLSDVIQIDFSSGYRVGALKSDGTIVIWGEAIFGPQTGQPNVSDFVQIGVGREHACGLRSNHTVVCWGSSHRFLSLDVPPLTDVVALSVGYEHSCALRSNGIVQCWGHSYGLDAPNGLQDVDEISVGYGHACALKRDRTVVCWSNDNTPQALSDVSHITTGWNNTCAVKTNGTVVCWGLNRYGESVPPSETLGLKSIEMPSAGACILQSDSTVKCWSDSSSYPYMSYNVPSGLGSVSQISAGSQHVCALKNDGTVVCWGTAQASNNYFGQIDVPEGLGNVSKIVSGYLHSCALKSDTTVVCWGNTQNPSSTEVPLGLTGVTDITLGISHSCALKSDNTVVCWGNISAPPVGLMGVINITSGQNSTCVLKNTGGIVCWGTDNVGGSLENATSFVGISLGKGYTHSAYGIKNDGTIQCLIYCYGSSIPPIDLGNVSSITSSNNNTCAVESDGTLTCWGYWYSQGGNNPYSQGLLNYLLDNVTQVSLSDYSICAINGSGALSDLICWGQINR